MQETLVPEQTAVTGRRCIVKLNECTDRVVVMMIMMIKTTTTMMMMMIRVILKRYIKLFSVFKP